MGCGSENHNEGTGTEKEQKFQKSQEIMVLPKEEGPETQRLQNRIAQRVGDSIPEHQTPKLQKEGRSARKQPE